MKVEFSAGALRDLRSIEAYTTKQDPQIFVDLNTALRSAVEFVTNHVNAGTPTEQAGVRKWRIGHTPFLMFYSSYDDLLFIRRIRHQREDWRVLH